MKNCTLVAAQCSVTPLSPSSYVVLNTHLQGNTQTGPVSPVHTGVTALWRRWGYGYVIVCIAVK